MEMSLYLKNASLQQALACLNCSKRGCVKKSPVAEMGNRSDGHAIRNLDCLTVKSGMAYRFNDIG